MDELTSYEKMLLDWKLQHKVETFKSLITVSLEAFKYLALVNGGAAAGMLTAMDKIVCRIGVGAFRFSVGAFVLGLAACGAAMVLSWLTQLALHDDNRHNRIKKRHPVRMWVALGFVVCSLVCFCAGAMLAAFAVH